MISIHVLFFHAFLHIREHISRDKLRVYIVGYGVFVNWYSDLFDVIYYYFSVLLNSMSSDIDGNIYDGMLTKNSYWINGTTWYMILCDTRRGLVPTILFE